jgi:plasmid maintenance system antidote protein VapI
LDFSRYFGNIAQFRLNLQAQYDLCQAQEENEEVYNHIPVAPFMHVVKTPVLMTKAGA